jgi:hypothetical protein
MKKWLKIEQLWSSGGGTPTYRYYRGLQKDMEVFVGEIEEEYDRFNDWSEHWRRIETEWVETPPKHWLVKRLSVLDNRIKYLEIEKNAIKESLKQ